jgi:hypothetical protein
MTTAHGRLHAATLELAKASPIKQRLTLAFSNFLRDVDAEDLPPELRAPFATLRTELEAIKPLAGETAVQATVRKMSPEQAETYALRVVNLYGDLLRSPTSVTKMPLREKRDDGSQVVPLLFAAEA